MARLVLMFVCALFFCSASAQYNVKYISSDGDLVKMRCVGYANKAKEAVVDAELSAVKMVLFQGVSGEPRFSSPLISVTEREAVHENKKYFNDFYDGGYKRFVVSSEILTKLKKDASKRKSMTMDVTVNVRTLREDLERNGVIRKFGL
jgi:hypothetical protein